MRAERIGRKLGPQGGRARATSVAAVILCSVVSLCGAVQAQPVDVDGDGWPDDGDNCPVVVNADQLDGDEDGLGDACDPFPSAVLEVRPDVPRAALTGEWTPIVYRLTDPSGELLPDLVGVRMTVTLDGSAEFDVSADRGVLLDGGGTGRALVEFENGIVEISMRSPIEEVVTLDGEDSEGMGVEFLSGIFESFERDAGGFVHSGSPDPWEYGIPGSGPGAAFSGDRAWATRLFGPYDPRSEGRLDSPSFRLDSGDAPRLEFRSWLRVATSSDRAWVFLYRDGSSYTLDTLDPSPDGYAMHTLDLSRFAGDEAYIRFYFDNDNSRFQDAGWFIDDVSIIGTPTTVELLAPGEDADGDGIRNADEIDAGTDPRFPDTEGDGHRDDIDNCPSVSNAAQDDVIHPNGIGDACEDFDLDDSIDLADNCPSAANADQADSESDGAGDACDNCPDLFNPEQRDSNADGTGDACTEDPGVPGPAHTPFVLPFEAEDVEFDPVRSLLYASADDEPAVYAVDLATGLVVTELRFDLEAGPIHVTRDGARLFVGLKGLDGRVASIDLERFVKDREFDIRMFPLDLVATVDGRVVVSGNAKAVFDGATGVESGRLGDLGTRLALDVSEQVVYAASGSGSFRFLERYAIPEEGGIVFKWPNSLEGGFQPSRSLWTSPRGEALVTGSRAIFTTSDDVETDLHFRTNLDVSRFVSHVAWDVERQVMFTATDRDVEHHNAFSYLRMGGRRLERRVRWVGVQGDTIYAVQPNFGRTYIETFPHPVPDGGSNTAPTARFAIGPEPRTTRSDLSFDASGSTDEQDALAVLRFRWDFDDDGKWDTLFLDEPTVAHRYDTAGTKRVRVQVRDRLSLTDEALQTFDIAFEPDPSDPGSHPIYELPYDLYEVLFDPVRPLMYASALDDGGLLIVNLETGAIEAQFPFGRLARGLTVDPDASHLFFGFSEIDDEPSEIVRFDLETRSVEARFPLEGAGPNDMVATGSERLVVSRGQEPLAVFDALTGERIGELSRSVGPLSLVLHPSETKVYGITDARVHRFDLREDGAIERRWDKPVTGHGLWGSPRGDVLVDSGTAVFSLGDEFATDVKPQGRFGTAARDLTFDGDRRLIVTGLEDELSFYNLDSYLPFGSTELSTWVQFVGVSGERVFAVLFGDFDRTLIEAFDHPAPGGATNTAPHAAFRVAPEEGATTLTDIRFDASVSTDQQDDLSNLEFRWDFDNDGEWDTAFSSEATAERRFESAGTRLVRLQVKDSLGLADENFRFVDVAFEPAPGEPPPETPRFDLPFAPVDVVFDRHRRKLYAVDEAVRGLYFVDLPSGRLEHFVQLEAPARTVAMAPGGPTLFVAAPPPPLSVDGRIQGFDLASGWLDREFSFDEEPFDIVVIGGRRLVVSAFEVSGHPVLLVDEETGEIVDRTVRTVTDRRRMTHHPSGLIYSAPTVNRGRVVRLQVQSDGNIVNLWEWLHGSSLDAKGNVWVSPHGDRLITGGGDLLSAGGDSRETDMIFIRSLSESPIEAAVWSVATGEMFTLSGSRVHSRDPETYEPVAEWEVGAAGNFMGLAGKWLYVLEVGDRSTTVRTINVNHAPAADAGDDTVTECASDEGTTVALDGSRSSDPDSLPGTNDDIVRFEWLENYGLPDERTVGEGERLDVTLGPGDHAFTLRVTDEDGEWSTSDVVKTVADTVPPEVSVSTDPEILWPPNGKLVPVHTNVRAADACSEPSVRLISVEDSASDGSARDVQSAEPGSPDFEVALRARRDGSGSGRTYTIRYAVTDAAGNEAIGEARVIVPHDRSSNRSKR